MTPEQAAGLVRGWAVRYTRAVPGPIARRRLEELDADLDDHIRVERALGRPESRIAVEVLSRMVRGIPADLTWRAENARPTADHRAHAGGVMPSRTTTHRLAVAATLAGLAFLAWGVAAMGIVGAEGDPFDLLYLGLVVVGVVAAGLARFRPAPMVRILLAMAAGQTALTALALLLGKHTSPVSSVLEIVGVNAMYVVLFLGAAWLFHRAAGPEGGDAAGPQRESGRPAGAFDRGR